MRLGAAIRQPIGRALATVPAMAVWRRRGFGRPLAAVLVLALIGGALTVARSLLDPGAAGSTGPRSGWPATAMERERLGDPGVGPDLDLRRRGRVLPQAELEAALAQLKDGAFGVVFPAVAVERLTDRPRARAPTAAAAAGTVAPIVSIDAANPPLRIDIMGLDTHGRINPTKGDGFSPTGGAP